VSGDSGSDTADGNDEQPTVSFGSEGFQPEEDGRTTAGGDQRTTAGAENAVPPPDDEFGARGWLLVGVLVVCFVVLPVVVTLRPVRLIGFRATYLLLPLVPAVLLGAAAVWVAVRSRRE
jgi:hypothetical protein